MFSPFQYLFDSCGGWIAFRAGKMVFSPGCEWIGWLPFEDTTVVTPAGDYLGTIISDTDRLARADPTAVRPSWPPGSARTARTAWPARPASAGYPAHRHDRSGRRGMRLSRQEVADFFATTRVSISGNPRLRQPQQDGHAAAAAHFGADGGRAMEQIPVGCGKSGLITLLPFGVAEGRVLTIAPNLTIRDQLVAALDSTNPGCFYGASAALADLRHGPFVAALNTNANLSDLDEAHVAVTNIQQLAAGGGRWLGNLPVDYFDLILVDEGHHNAAPSWQRVFERFPRAKVLSLTATPFRGDDQPVEGEVIYSYPIAEAMRRGYIKHIQASNVAPAELMFTYRGSEHIHTLEEVLRLKDRDWFSRGVALAERCNISIVDASIEWLRHLRETGTHHQVVAVACSVDHARAIRRLYEERGYRARTSTHG